MATVLFVGQETHLRYVVVAMLRDMHRVIVAETREAAAQTIAEEPVDVVLCSVRFDDSPRRNLLDLAPRATSDRRVPIVALLERGYHASSLGGEADHVVHSPFSSKQLRAALQAQLAAS
ncbi:MAG: hypothetical protein HYY04_12905 [Chloroflexi bacterium]|nr:hypothetical protein [Chloroflexota bacterium]